MRRKIIIAAGTLITLFLVWAGVALMSSPISSSSAQSPIIEAEASEASLLDPPIDNIVQSDLLNATLVGQEASPEIENPTANTDAADEQLVQEIQMLTDQWLREISRPGWLHINSHWTEDLDNGTLIAKEYVKEEWYLLNDQGEQVVSVTISRDLNQQPLQVGALRAGAWYNLTYGVIIPVLEESLPLKFRYDFGFPELAANYLDSLDKQETQLNGQTVWLYTITENYLSGLSISSFNSPISSMMTRAYYDPKSGALLLYEMIFVMPDGTQRVRASAALSSWESVEQPPDNVLEVLIATTTEEFKTLSQAAEEDTP